MLVAGQPVQEHQLDPPALGPNDVGTSLLWIESHPVVRVRLGDLRLEDSPRSSGEDMEHVHLLADVDGPLPPITVHRPTMRVIDGAHRVRAAQLNGSDEIEARLLDCPGDSAFVLAVRANITHGLPLSHADRAAAAARIVACHPEWSDRAVAAVTGISDKTVCRIRSRSLGDGTPPGKASDKRLGRDGRSRPLDSGLRRLQAAAMINDKPAAGLREVARATGLSTATVHDVRRRLMRGEDPVPGRYRAAASAGQVPGPYMAVRGTVPTAPPAPTAGAPSATPAATAAPAELTAPAATASAAASAAAAGLVGLTPPTAAVEPDQGAGAGKSAVNRRRVLARLCEDPSVRMSEAGRTMLRWLHHYALDPVTVPDLETLGRGLPPHWAPEVADLARSCAAVWAQLADHLQPETTSGR